MESSGIISNHSNQTRRTSTSNMQTCESSHRTRQPKYRMQKQLHRVKVLRSLKKLSATQPASTPGTCRHKKQSKSHSQIRTLWLFEHVQMFSTRTQQCFTPSFLHTKTANPPHSQQHHFDTYRQKLGKPDCKASSVPLTPPCPFACGHNLLMSGRR